MLEVPKRTLLAVRHCYEILPEHSQQEGGNTSSQSLKTRVTSSSLQNLMRIA